MSDLVQATGSTTQSFQFPGVEIIFIFRSGQAGNTGANNTDLEQPQTCLPHDSPDVKSCCGISVSQTVSIRWFIVMIAFVGICCAVVGTVLGAMKASGREHLTVSLLMIGQYHSITPVTSSQGEFQSEFSHSVHPFLSSVTVMIWRYSVSPLSD